MDNYLSNLKVVYVEDEGEIMAEMSRFLKKRLGKLACFENGKEALKELQREKYDVLITDLRMPEMDGIELITKVREVGLKLPVIIMSAFSDTETILKVVNLGIVKYLVKPIKTGDLIDYLTEVNEEKLAMAKSKAGLELGQLNKDVKLEMEKSISSEMAFFQKSISGKGPKSIQVFISAMTVEVKILEPYTQYELTLIKNERNVELISYARQRFYSDNSTRFVEIVEKAININVRLAEIKSSPLDGVDCLIFNTL